MEIKRYLIEKKKEAFITFRKQPNFELATKDKQYILKTAHRSTKKNPEQ